MTRKETVQKLALRPQIVDPLVQKFRATLKDVTTSDLWYMLFDGFPSASITGYFPRWYEASIWAERVNTMFVLLSIVAIATETLLSFTSPMSQSSSILRLPAFLILHSNSSSDCSAQEAYSASGRKCSTGSTYLASYRSTLA